MKYWFSGVISVLIAFMSLQPVFAQTDTVITQCDYQHVSKAVAVGGNIILDCDRLIPIWANKPLTIAINTTLKPAESRKVTFAALKGRAFVVNSGITLTIEDVIIQGNPNERGGGIENNGGKVFITNVTFTDNDETAILNHKDGSITIEDSLFTDNKTFAGGGAIHNDAEGEINIHNSSFANNQSWSNSNGGAISNLGTMTISGSTFSENDAQGIFAWGGAIFNTEDGILTVSNSTFTHNTAGHSGGAIRNDTNGKTNISFSTFVENSTNVEGGALYVKGGELKVSNSLFFHNTVDKTENDCDNQIKLGTISTLNNLSDAGCGETAAIGVANLSNNGGNTQTVAIASDSNAIDAASECPAEAIDGRGVARPQGDKCDIGAYEFVELTTAVTTLTLCQVTTTRDIRLRNEPNTAGSILAVVPHNSTFQALEHVTGWYHITYGTVDGWVSAEFVTAKGSCSG